MVVLVNRSAHSAKAVVAVGKNIGNGKALKTAAFGGLYYSDVCDVMRN